MNQVRVMREPSLNGAACPGWDDPRGATEQVAKRARRASRRVARLSGARKAAALTAMAEEVERGIPSILEANREDLALADQYGLSEASVDRLRLDADRLGRLADSLREIASFPDPVGEVGETVVRPNGLRVGRMRVPLGVVAVIYESRPDVTADAAALCLLSGNAVILRGGKEAFRSNHAIAGVLRRALEREGAPLDAVQLVGTTDRAAVDTLLRQERWIDLVIPRGGEGLIRAVVEKSLIPVLKHDRGVCHIYLDRSADAETAASIVLNAKAQRPGVCNAVETLLVHADPAAELLPGVAEALWNAGVELRGCPRTREILGERVTSADEEDWAAEYLALVLAVRVVDGMDEAVEHIHRWGSDHTEAVVTNDYARAHRFVREVGSSTVLVNASTRFADGGQLGLGAEIGISTSRLHAYGPMGARELTTRKFVVFGDGQVRE